MTPTPPKPAPGPITRLALARAERHGWTPPLYVEDITSATEVAGEADEEKIRRMRLPVPTRPASTPTPPPPTPLPPADPQIIAALAAIEQARVLARQVDLDERRFAAEVGHHERQARAARRLHPRARLVLRLVGGVAAAYIGLLAVFAVLIATGQVDPTPPPLVQTTTIPATPVG